MLLLKVKPFRGSKEQKFLKSMRKVAKHPENAQLPIDEQIKIFEKVVEHLENAQLSKGVQIEKMIRDTGPNLTTVHDKFTLSKID